MWATTVIVFREILEAALVVSLVVAATQGVPRRGRFVVFGILAGIAGAGLIALLAEPITALADGMGQEIFNATILLLAVLMLTWHLVWMRRHSLQISNQIKGMSTQLLQGNKSLLVITTVIGLAILREGAEIILLLHGVAAAGTDSAQQMLGGLIGLLVGVAVGTAIYFGLVRIPVRYFFKVTGALILLLTAGLAAQAAAFLSQADILPSLGNAIWDTSALLSEQSLPGQIIHSLTGYVSQPSGIQLIFYLGTLLTVGLLVRLVNRPLQLNLSTAAALILTVSAGLTLAPAAQVHASDKIYSPYVEQGEFEVEFRGHVTNDKNPAKDRKQKHKLEIGYGVTSRWYTAIFGEWEKKPGEKLEYEATSWENIFQLTEQGQYSWDVGFYLEYEFAKGPNAADKIETKLLLEHPGQKFTHTANIILEREVGPNANNATEFEFYWRTKYRLKSTLEPAIELYSKFGELGNTGNFNDQKHMLGPVLLGKIPLGQKSKLKYEFGYLVGLSDSAPDGTWKAVLEYEMHF